MKNPNQVIQAGKLKIKSEISAYQRQNQVPNFIIELIISEILNEIKELRLSEMYIETLKTEDKNGDTEQAG